MNVNVWSDRIIRWGFYLLFALVPLLFTPWNYELFEFNKMIGVYMLTIIITGAWMVKSITQKEFHVARTPLDIPIALFVSSQFVSSLFSMDPHVSWFGYYSRFNGGMFSIMSYVLLYYAYVSNLKDDSGIKNLKVVLGSGAIVALYGVAERLGVDKNLWVQDVQNRVFSSLGQPNWLAAYLVALLPISLAFGLKKYLWFGVSVLFFVVLLFTRSRSGLLGFAVADVVFWGLIFLQTKRPLISFVILHVSFVILFVFFGPSLPIPSLSRSPIIEATPSASYTAPLLETGGTESGTIRKYVWQGAINAWQSSLKTYLIGTGTETFAFAFYQYRPVGHNLTSEWDFLYNKAHNEYLNYLATTGIFGLGSYLLFIGVFIVWFIKCQMSNVKDQINLKAQSSKKSLDFGFDWKFDIWILEFALFAGWISILVTNFFGFSVVILQVFLFLFPAMALVGNKQLHISLRMPRFTVWIVVLFTVVLVIFVAALWYADTLYASGYRESRAGQYGPALSHLSRASVLNPLEPVFFDELGSVYAGLVTAAVGEKDATKAAMLVKKSLASSDKAITASPKNVNFWKSRTKIYYSFSEFDPVFNDAAIEALGKAALLSPNDPKITYNLAILYGRKGSNEKAIELLNTTITLKPNYRDAYFALWVFYAEVKRPELARMVLTDYLTKVDPADKDFLERLNQ